MARVRIVTDSTADLPDRLYKEHDIRMVPLNVHFGEEVYRDHIDIKSSEFYTKLVSSKDHPRTSQPSPGDFLELYKELTADGDHVVSVHLSGALSGTLQSAALAKEMLPGATIELVDTRSGSLGIGLVALAAARAAKAGKSAQDVAAEAREIAARMHLVMCVDTLEYLARNGRIGKAQAFLGGLLSVKPVLGLEDGVVVPLDKARGRGRALERVVELVQERVPAGSPVHVAIVHANVPDEADQMLKRLEGIYTVREGLTGIIGPVIGVHVGPGTLGIVLYRD